MSGIFWFEYFSEFAVCVGIRSVFFFVGQVSYPFPTENHLVIYEGESSAFFSESVVYSAVNAVACILYGLCLNGISCRPIITRIGRFRKARAIIFLQINLSL